MKITKSQLKQIIKEELEKELDEGLGDWVKAGAEKLKGLGRKKTPSIDLEYLKSTGKTGKQWAEAIEHEKGTAYALLDWWLRAFTPRPRSGASSPRAGDPHGHLDSRMKLTIGEARHNIDMLASQMREQPPSAEKGFGPPDERGFQAPLPIVRHWAAVAAKELPRILQHWLSQDPSKK